MEPDLGTSRYNYAERIVNRNSAIALCWIGSFAIVQSHLERAQTGYKMALQ